MSRIRLEAHDIEAGDTAKGLDLRGWIEYIQYTRPASPYDNGATLTVKVKRPDGLHEATILTGISLNADFLFYPRTPVHDASGAVIAGVAARHVLANAKIEFDVTGGGAVTNTGDFLVAIER